MSKGHVAAPTRLAHGTPSRSDSADLVLARRIFHGEGSDINLPVMYLLDSICKNVGGAFVQQFERLFQTFAGFTAQ